MTTLTLTRLDRGRRRGSSRRWSSPFLALGAVLLAWSASGADEPAQKEEPTSDPPVHELQLPAEGATDFLRRSEAWIRPSKPEELLSLGRELEARGQEEAARQVYDSLETTPDDYQRLVESLLRANQLDAAETVLRAWRRQSPDSAEAAMLQAALFHGRGQAELALRELRSVRSTLTDEQRRLAGLYELLLAMETQGVAPGPDANPWGARFADADGNYVAASISAEQLAKVPPDVLPLMITLVSRLPTRGDYWALLGELFNAAGDPETALQCFHRAERTLLYSTPTLRAHRRILEDHAQEVAQATQRALDEAIAAKSKSASKSDSAMTEEVDGGATVEPSASRTGVIVILTLGGLLVVVVGALQVREWVRSAQGRNRSDGSSEPKAKDSP
ncbi:hypothetical protein Pan216_38240 [Planctomycetes bacterium Pan216]|uniref:Tetratricopeptide repeat protein n=1 Tax=Kolteria novifilia TaxID=2527975 RepID=A0A518B7J4_9BACT|nr:hypothetical protein Pan216_38240 [Planctomycetes bacterium Pan216]